MHGGRRSRGRGGRGWGGRDRVWIVVHAGQMILGMVAVALVASCHACTDITAFGTYTPVEITYITEEEDAPWEFLRGGKR